jgi:hypothetical protein
MASRAMADVTRLSAEQRTSLEHLSGVHELLSTRDLPRSLAALCADINGRLAEPGARLEVSDALTDELLPRKRLIWAVHSGECYIVHYESGGRGHSFHVLMVTLATPKGKPQVVWRGIGGKLKDYAAFAAALRRGKLDDQLNYGD